MFTIRVSRILVASLLVFVASVWMFPSRAARGQERMLAPTAPDACPVELADFHTSATFTTEGAGLRVKNLTKNDIVGLVFDVALADAAENWKWLHWNFDDTRPLEDFGWNKPIKAGENKKISWSSKDLGFEHNGGGAFVLTSILFADGSGYRAPADNSVCKLVWYNSNKKGLVRQVELPARQ